ncbi:DUF3570 domain-containing protein [Exilibacterium tricleocarpae]|uniref:DUF3570 domain-containing protein n=1 Tax=Exilibacterium tricleocarpae TaxID=2591008 RepID=A0A545TZT8_9GAMM|nr:DUF3570 domain-containing protein [Exilibacterium tricleocarpae]
MQRLIAGGLLLCAGFAAQAAVLPEDRLDILYHAFDGGGVTIDGPSILVRKDFANTVSVSANYYLDMVSSASIDVEVSGASRYEEERTEYSVGIDYLYDRTLMSLSYTNSTENDYEADTVGFGISQEFFGAMTTLTMGFSIGDNTIRRTNDDEFEEEAQGRRYSIGLSQVLTKNWMAAIGIESVADEGYLQNPYRFVRFFNPTSPTEFTLEEENYPDTRNSDALSLRTMYYLPYRASLRGEYRLYSDNWGIEASNYEVRYIHPVGQNWVFEAKFRQYEQTKADFYQDIYEFAGEKTLRGRDKELSTYTTTSFGLGVSYQVRSQYLSVFDKSTINLFWDFMQFRYDDFRDARESLRTDPNTDVPAGQESLYEFDANVIRLFISFWY